MLQQLMSSQVPASVRSRGQKYHQRGAVTILDGSNAQIRALVEGGADYQVLIRRLGKHLGAYCTCAYCEDRFEVCKHIWAVILAGDQAGYFKSVSGRARIRIVSSLADDIEADLDDDDEDEIDDEGFYDEDEPQPRWQSQQRTSARPRQSRQRRPSWRDQLAGLRQTFEQDTRAASDWPAGREIVYIVDAKSTLAGKGLTIELAQRYRKKDGDWSKPKAESIGRSVIAQLPDAADRHILSLLSELRGPSDPYYSPYSYSYDGILRVSLPETLFESMMPDLCRTGRCLFRHGELSELTQLDWCDGPPWQFKLEINRESPKGGYVLSGAYHRDTERKHIAEPALLVPGGLIFWPDRVARLDDGKAFRWLMLLRREGFLTIPAKDASKLLAELLEMPALPPLTLPEELHYEEVRVAPRCQLQFKKPSGYWTNEVLIGELSFAYEDQEVGEDSRARGLFDAKQRRLLLRDRAAEQAAAARLAQLGMGTKASYGQVQRQLSPKKLPHVAATLLKEGWHVQAEGKLYRQASSFKIDVQSGVDWFDLHAAADFDGQQVALPALLAALGKGENLVRLGDGSFGMLPEEWLKKMGFVGKLGAIDKDRVRFRKTQVGFLDALLAAQPEATCDAVFDRARQALQRFNGVGQADAPQSFTGALRSYQREGLGWMHFLDEFGFGGCLADDMGLGKTVQVLALLEERRGLRKKNKLPASLVVVPRSLVFNWKQEAERFTPQLRVLDHTGLARVRDAKAFDAHDLVVTTYGTLRRDAELLTGYDFDYCILDEAQAIKNTNTDTAKAARLLKGSHRLALSGTPVENHLGELWSLFEFLNPGMLGHASVLQLTGAGRSIDPETRALLASALRPFLLRRTKEQVATDLPAKTEQTVFCDLDAGQRQHYDELRDYYRKSLLDTVERDGLGRAKIMVLEALLRLRQAACHPGLVDKKRVNDPATKLDLLLPRLREVTEEGHKALAFSQFTQFLSIIRKRLDDEGIVYEYLDGRTRDRAARVERFQNDPECRLFLISLKAGGLGLNLTAAEYVFLIDPWWNPAVEAQAVDRAHRIGQDKPVFAYRLIARDTVEEKVLELQKTKRALADAIINADNSLIRNLTKEDLQLLLS